MNRRQKIIVSVTGIFLVLLILVGLTYAYFLTRIIGNTNDKSISVTTANLALKYDDGSGVLTIDKKIVPNTTISKKTFSVENTGDTTIAEYAVTLDDLTIINAKTNQATYLEYPEDFKLKITCLSSKSGKTCNGYNDVMPSTNDILLINSIDEEEVQTYTLTLTYIDSGIDQSADMNKTIEAKVDIIDTNGTFDIEGVVTNYSTGDYVQVNSAPKISYLNKEGKYKVVGLLPGEHTVSIYNTSNKTTPKSLTAVTLKIGETANVSNAVITMTTLQRVATININSNSKTYEINDEVDYMEPTLLLKQGDYVRYKYLYTGNTYITPEISTGKSVHSETQSYNSTATGSNRIESWRVFSNENGIIKLIANVASANVPKLTLTGENGYVNAEYVLDEMCEVLYSGQHGSARSIDADDLNGLVGYTGKKAYLSAANTYIKLDNTLTLSQLEQQLGKTYTGGTYAPGDKNIKNVEINYYTYRTNTDDKLGGGMITKPLKYGSFIGYDKTVTYWLATNMNQLYFYDDESEGAPLIKYRVAFWDSESKLISAKNLYSSDDVEGEATTYSVIPIVTLNSNLKIKKWTETSPGSGLSDWTLTVNNKI